MKLKLKDLKVKSFVTEEKKQITGGCATHDYSCGQMTCNGGPC